MTSKSRGATTKRKAHNQIVAEMIEGAKQAVAIMRGEADPSTYRVHFGEIDVREVRKKTGLTQDGFANTFGFSAGSVRDWEQRRVMPDQAARAYLYVIGQKPDMVRETLAPIYQAAKRSPQHARASKPMSAGMARKASSRK